MTAKKTSFRKPVEPLPDYEILTEREKETTRSEDCCVCGDPNSTWCNPENPNGIGTLANGVGALIIAANTGK